MPIQFISGDLFVNRFQAHGHIRGGGDSSKQIVHAWVELPGDFVYDGVLERLYRREGYYAKRDALSRSPRTRFCC